LENYAKTKKLPEYLSKTLGIDHQAIKEGVKMNEQDFEI